jgi:hypothetical protein
MADAPEIEPLPFKILARNQALFGLNSHGKKPWLFVFNPHRAPQAGKIPAAACLRNKVGQQ